MSHSEGRSELSARIVAAIAEEEGVHPTAVEPLLYDVVDPEALVNLFESHEGGPDRDAGMVQFRMGQYTVTVRHDDTVEVDPPSGSVARGDAEREEADLREDGGVNGRTATANLD
jgi:hypothetical protein